MKILELHYSTAAAGAEKTGHPLHRHEHAGGN